VPQLDATRRRTAALWQARNVPLTPQVAWIDVFTGDGCLGNPAAVVVTELPLADEAMLGLAAELALSETAFAVHGSDGCSLRWFTPTVEMDLCGHATIASARVLRDLGALVDGEGVTFLTRSGPLECWVDGDAAAVSLPCSPPVETEIPLGLIDQEVRCAHVAGDDLLLELATPAEVIETAADLAAMAKAARRLAIVFSEGGEDADMTLRVFGPSIGIPEDPATGGAQCSVAPLMGARLGLTTIRSHQASTRGARLISTLIGERIEVGGRTRPVLAGNLDEAMVRWAS